MEVTIFNGEDLAYNLSVSNCKCEFIDTVITSTYTIYKFRAYAQNFTPAKLKTAVIRLSVFMGVDFDYKIGGYGFDLIYRRPDTERIFPTFNKLSNYLTDGSNSFVLGEQDDGTPKILSLDECVHCLVSGQTGSGKSVFINSVIASLGVANSPKDLSLMLIDIKRVEFAQWKNSCHLACPIINDSQTAVAYLNGLVDEMERRYEILAEKGKVKDDCGIFDKTVVIIDELADLMLASGKAVEEPIIRLAQKARACGIHLILCTQRPTVNVVTGLIKANIPTRIAFSTASTTDSVVMLDHKGAEKLQGKGDGICKLPNGQEIHFQAPYISEQDIYEMLEPAREYQRQKEEKRKQEEYKKQFLQELEKKQQADNISTKPLKAPKSRFKTFLDKLFAKSKNTAHNGGNAVYDIDELNDYDCME